MDARNWTIRGKAMSVPIASSPPAGSALALQFDQAYYADCFAQSVGPLPLRCASEVYFNLTASSPLWVNMLLKLRDSLVSLFGFTPTNGFARAGGACRQNALAPGSDVDFFRVRQISDTELVLGLEDAHFDVLLSIYLNREVEGDRVFITSIVQPHTSLGKLYLAAIKPFHKCVVKSMLKRLS